MKVSTWIVEPASVIERRVKEIRTRVGLDPTPMGFCVVCGRQLCAELDAYWGRSTLLAKYCSKCRPRMKP